MQPLMISVIDACQRWGVGKSRLYQLVGSGDIEAVKLGVKTLLVVESGDAFFRSLPRFGADNTRRAK